MSKFQELCDSIGAVKKTGTNPHFKNTYIPLQHLLPIVKEKCEESGWEFVQRPIFIDGKSVLETVFKHKDGEVITGNIELVHKAEDPQKLGASITYMRRYMLTCMLQIEEEDDDGNTASGVVKQVKNNQKPW
jgi:hypothetical protein